MGIVKYASFAILEAEFPASAGGEQIKMVAADRKVAHRHEFDYEPRPGFLYVRSRAISSRCNDNHDEFPAEEIKKGYLSFIGKPVFVNHHNDNHKRARGVIIAAALHEDVNPDGTDDTWAEVLMEVDAVRFPMLAMAIIKGEIDRTSMGTDVEYSQCSFCGNKAKTPLEYCRHIPKLKGQRIRRITSSGTPEDVLVREICYGLHFFENSLLVEEPADPTAYFLGVDTRGVEGMVTTASSSYINVMYTDSQTSDNLAWTHAPIAKVAYGEQVAPPVVDTLRDEECPVCGEKDSYSGERCAICGFIKPPDMFMDPDLDAAKENDLRQDQGQDATDADPAEVIDQSTGLEQDPAAQDPNAPPGDDLIFHPPDQQIDPAAQVPGDQQPPEAEAQDDASDEDEDDEEESDDPQGSDDEQLKKKKKDKKGSPPHQSVRVHREGADVTMRQALAAAAEQQVILEAQARQIDQLERTVATIANLAGLSDHPEVVSMLALANAIPGEIQQRVARIRRQADTENPAQPIPEPGQAAPAATTADTLGDLNDDDVTAPGATGTTDVSPDATEDVQGTTTVLDEPLSLNEQDVTAPVAGTTDQRPLDEVKIETDVRAPEGDNTSTMFPLQGPFAEQARTSSVDGRTWASLRLARLRLQARVEQGDDLAIGERIALSDASDEVIQNEIDTLQKVVSVQPRVEADARRLVPRQGARTAPSFAPEGLAPEVMAVTAGRVSQDEMLFEG